MHNITYLTLNHNTQNGEYYWNVLKNSTLAKEFENYYYSGNNNNNNINNNNNYSSNINNDVIFLLNEKKLKTNANDYINGSSFAFAIFIVTFFLILCCTCCVCSWLNHDIKKTRSERRNRIILDGQNRRRRRRHRDNIVGAATAAAIQRELSDLSNENNNARRNHLRRIQDNGGGGSDRTNPSTESGFHSCDFEIESLPSYTIVSGLPTYDDALDQLRKTGIILTPIPSIIKVFDPEGKQQTFFNSSAENLAGEQSNSDVTGESSTTCICGSLAALNNDKTKISTIATVIELSPDHLKLLNQKRLSLQLAVNNLPRRSGSRIDLYREVNRSNLLRSHDLPQIHRSTSSLSATGVRGGLRIPNNCERFMQHRGSVV